MADAGIVRNRLKIESAIATRARSSKSGGNSARSTHICGLVNGRPQQNFRRGMKQVPARTPLSDAISKDLKLRGFRSSADHRLCLYAGGRNGQRPSDRLFSARAAALSQEPVLRLNSGRVKIAWGIDAPVRRLCHARLRWRHETPFPRKAIRAAP